MELVNSKSRRNMSILTNLLSLLGNSAFISAFIPSLAFILGSFLVFDPILNTSNLFSQENAVDTIAVFSILIVLPTLILSYTLIALNSYLIKLFEGYIFFNRFPFMRNAHIKLASNLMRRRDGLKKRIQAVEEYKTKSRSRMERKKDLLLRLNREYYSVAARYDQSYPPSLSEVMPTKVGNILKSSESYAGTRYGMDGVAFWPRLYHVIPNCHPS